MTKIKINIFDKSEICIEEIYEIKTSETFEYIELNDVYVKTIHNKAIVYTNHIFKYDLVPHLKFESINEHNSNSTLGSNTEIEQCILLSTRFTNVYFHWIYDILPQLSITEHYQNVSCLTLPFKHKYQQESLNFFAPNNKIYSNFGIYKIQKLFISFPTTQLLMPKNFVFNYLRKNEFFNDNSYSYVYITRKKGFKRRILNEPELIKYLISFGFKIYSLENMTFENQKYIFSKAGVILSAHGSGLSNIIFCNPNCKIYEIYGPGCGERCFARIAHKLRLPYMAIRINNLSYTNIFMKYFYCIFPNSNPFHFKIDLKLFHKYMNSLKLTVSYN